jgi:hypothetical protein
MLSDEGFHFRDHAPADFEVKTAIRREQRPSAAGKAEYGKNRRRKEGPKNSPKARSCGRLRGLSFPDFPAAHTKVIGGGE